MTTEIRYNSIQDINDVVDFFLANDEQMVGNPLFADASNVGILKQSLFGVLSKVESEAEYEEMLNYKQLLFRQIVHYSETLEQIEELKEDLHELIIHNIYLGTEHRLLVWIFMQLYKREPDLSNKDGRTPQGFLRYMKMNCKPEVTAHFIGMALQQYLRTNYSEEPYYAGEEFFTASYNYMVELIMESEEIEKLLKTIQEQQEELMWLRDMLISTEQQLQTDAGNETLIEKQTKMAADFMTEKFEMEFLSTVLLRLF
ncbi:hypothetical protein [Paenibacillus koleovorans]|uniref:hypothetical protein n=1 Tax=Paenibacillus koleovorans TaxID=121608 RepID=UPI000FDA7C4E|nr:hypothetical protein [Paenibacillus koleovorans]